MQQTASGSLRHPSLAAIAASLKRHRVLIKNVLTLLATTGLSLGLGFAYWNIAARLFSQQSVGYGSAAVSAMMLVSSFGTFGLNTLLVGALPNLRDRASLIAAAMLAAALGAGLVAVGFALIAPRFTTHYDDVAGSAGRAAIFCCGAGLSAASVVFDAATIGMLRSGLQFTRNITFALAKAVTLVGAAFVLHYTTGMGIFASWVAAIPVALFVVAVRFWIGGGAFIVPRPDFTALRRLSRSLPAHNWLNLALQTPSLLIPVLAASILAPATNAAYYVATTVTLGLFILPFHMSTVIFAMGSAEPSALAGRLRFALRVSLLLGLAGMVILGVGAHFILDIFGVGYARVATLPMRILLLSYLPGVPNFFYIAVARATNKLSQAAALVSGFTVLDIIAVVAGALKGGIVGMSVGDLTAISLEALVTTPLVLQAARGLGRHRRATSAVGTPAAMAGAPALQRRQVSDAPWRSPATREREQLRALAVLMSLATPSTVTMLAIGSDGDEGRRQVSGPRLSMSGPKDPQGRRSPPADRRIR